MKNLILVLILIIIAGGITYAVSSSGNKETITVTVTDKEHVIVVSDGSSYSHYLIYTEEGTYKLEDNLIYGNFRSSDWYGKIKIDSTYTFDLIGYIIGIISSYQNIVNFK